MSSKLHGLVWDGCAFAGLSLSRVSVMARLADFASDEGLSWPAIETIQRQIGAKSKNTVKAAIAELEADGWLTKKERKCGGRNLSSVYQLNVEKLKAAADAANEHYKPKKRAPQGAATIDPSKIDPSPVDASTIDQSKIDPSKIDRSMIGKVTPVDGSMVAPDPSFKTDPKDKNPSCREASPPDESADEKFLSRHPEAVVFSAKKKIWGSAEDLRCAEWMRSRIVRLYEQAAESDGEVARPKEPNWADWANEIRLMCSQDGRTHKQICELFARANRDPFWCKNILSPGKLREKWDDLTLKLSAAQVADAGEHWNTAEAWENTL